MIQMLLSKLRDMTQTPEASKLGHARFLQLVDERRAEAGCVCDPLVAVDKAATGIDVRLGHEPSCPAVPK